jgi:hypothetical protein
MTSGRRRSCAARRAPDVVEAPAFAGGFGLETVARWRARPGGALVDPGVLLDLTPLDAVELAAGAVTVGTGCRTGALCERLYEHGEIALLRSRRSWVRVPSLTARNSLRYQLMPRCFASPLRRGQPAQEPWLLSLERRTSAARSNTAARTEPPALAVNLENPWVTTLPDRL